MLDRLPTVVLWQLLSYLPDSTYAAVLGTCRGLRDKAEGGAERRRRCHRRGFALDDFGRPSDVAPGEWRARHRAAVGWSRGKLCPVKVCGHNKHLSSVSLTPDRKYLLASDRGGVRTFALAEHAGGGKKTSAKRLHCYLESRVGELGRMAVARSDRTDEYLVSAGSGHGDLLVWIVPGNMHDLHGSSSGKSKNVYVPPYSVQMKAHGADVHATHMVHCGDKVLLATASKDCTCGVFELSPPSCAMRTVHKFDSPERVWSCAFNPFDNNQLCFGTCGTFPRRCFDASPFRPVHLADVGRGAVAASCPSDGKVRKGVSAYSLAWWDGNCALSAGHEGAVRMWDFRAGGTVWQWDDPFDGALMCVKTDGKTILTGSSRYSVMWLLDVRRGLKQRRGVYLAKNRSPVYSLDFAYDRIFAALDERVIELAFQI